MFSSSNLDKYNDFLKLIIDELPGSTLYKLYDILNTNDNWKNLLSSLAMTCCWTIPEENIILKGNTIHHTPAKVLVQELSIRCITVGQFIKFLESIQLDQALLLLKLDEPLKIVEQPIGNIQLVASSNCNIILRCIATGFPTPKYRWYKDGVQLITQQKSTLSVNEICSSDSGTYWCDVHKINRKTNHISEIIRSNSSIVIVQGGLYGTGVPVIKQQPVSPSRKIIQGSHIVLSCIAEGATSYQWYCDDKPIDDETREDLHVNSSYLGNLKTKWSYVCRVSNKFGCVFSSNVTICLDVETENARFEAEDKVALLIANAKYDSLASLKLPSADVITFAEILKEKNFRVLALQNLSLAEMRNAVDLFCSLIRKGAYAVFYFVGHGFEDSDSYMLPVEASSSYLKDDSLNVQYVLEKMQLREPDLTLILLDMCRTLPIKAAMDVAKHPKSNIKVLNQSNVLFGYATSPMTNACERTNATNGIYMEHLSKFLLNDSPIAQILLEIQSDMEKEKQSPWISGNLSRKLSLDDPIRKNNTEPVLDKRWRDIGVCAPLASITHFNMTIEIQCFPHINVFNNSLDIILFISNYHLSIKIRLFCRNSNLELTNEETSLMENKTIIRATVNNLQKLQDNDLQLQLTFRSCDTNFPPSNLNLHIGKPMIAKENIWANSLE